VKKLFLFKSCERGWVLVFRGLQYMSFRTWDEACEFIWKCEYPDISAEYRRETMPVYEDLDEMELNARGLHEIYPSVQRKKELRGWLA